MEHRKPLAGLTLFICACLFIVLIVCLTIFRQQPPAAVSAGAPADTFSSARAMTHLHAIATTPHPIGSRAHAEVREYIVKTLSQMGLEAQVQKTTAARDYAGETVVADVQNILARFPGTDPALRPIVLAAHYDSVPNSPGAADDGSGVGILLETIRALRAGPPLKRDVILLFTDAEEIGLLGAKAFVEEHPWAGNVDLVLNFDARGNGGPVFMFETSGDNARLVDAYSRATAHPFASSLMYSIYRLLPANTDFTVFRGAGMSGMNFAFIGGLSRYHTPRDSLSTIDERSIQHGGSQAVALTKFFSTQQTDSQPRRNLVYFDFGGRQLFAYARSWTIPLLVVLLILYAAAVVVGRRKGLVDFRSIVIGFVSLVLSLMCSAAVATLLSWLLFGWRQRIAPSPDSPLLVASLLLFSVAVFSALFLRFGRRNGIYGLSLGALFGWLLGALGSGFLLPGASYLFIWPLMFSLVGLLLLLWLPTRKQKTWVSVVVLCLAGSPGLVLLAGTFHNIFLGIRFSFPAALVFLSILTLGLLVPLLSYLPAKLQWHWTGFMLLASVVLIVVACITRPNGNEFPRSNSLAYEVHTNSHESFWLSQDQKPDEWTSQFFADANKAEVSRSPLFPAQRVSLSAKAPLLDLPSAELNVLEDRTSDGVRLTRLRLTAPPDARVLNIQADPSTTVVSASINGKRVEYESPAREGDHSWELSYFAVPAQGFDLIIETRSGPPLKVTLSAFSDGLPEFAQAPVKNRPAHLMPARFSDMTSVVKTFDLDAASSSASVQPTNR
jgi:MFS family permease